MVANKQQKASGGSALKRLKKSLQTAGIVGQTSKASRSKKDRKRGKPTEVGKNDADKKLSLIRGEFNPFEQKTQKQKFEILGRKMKGVTGKPTLSKQIGEENRKKTLLVEMKNKNRQGGIIDKRFGENNPFLTPEEKMLERFTRERQKTSKATMFNLDDDDEDLSLTHYGQSLSTMDDFDDAGLALSDEEEGGKQMDANIVSQMHFGGFGDEAPGEERHKSKNEIMKEIIAKSKMHKAERQLAKEEDDALRENLDEELADIRGLLETKRKPLPSQSALFKRTESENPKPDLEDYSDYDKAVFELASDQRAQATDRTKTEEEIALEEKEKLEKAERARKRRMEGLDSESEEESGYRKMRAVKKRKGAPQGDDLEDDYLEELDEDAERLGRGLTLEQIQSALDDEDDEESGDDDEESGEDDDEDEDEEGETDNEDLEDGDDEPLEFGDDDGDDMNEFGANGSVQKKSKKKSVSSEDKKEIPFTFECPTSHEEFLTILDGLSVEDVLVVSKRIRVLYHIKLAPENKTKLGQFIPVLVEHIGYLASTVSPFPREVIEKLSLDVYELCQQLPESAANVFIDKLKTMENELGKKIKYNGSAWPTIEDMTVLRLIGQVFSTSDLNHPVASPSLLFINQALSQCRVQTIQDIGRGLFLTLFAFEYQHVSKRFIPECLNFLNKCLILLSPESVFHEKAVPGYFPIPAQKVEFSINQIDGKGIENIERIQFETFENEKGDEEQYKLSLFQAVLALIEKSIQLYASTPAFIEIYSSTLEVLKELNALEWHSTISEQMDKLINRLERQIKFTIEKRIKTPLLLQQHRPIPIAQHLPKFEKAYSMDRHYDPDHERSQQHKLEAQIKKEKKGALRELRKDNAFIARERAKERKQKDDAYNKMVKGVMSLLEGEQSEKNRLEREKSKK